MIVDRLHSKCLEFTAALVYKVSLRLIKTAKDEVIRMRDSVHFMFPVLIMDLKDDDRTRASQGPLQGPFKES